MKSAKGFFIQGAPPAQAQQDFVQRKVLRNVSANDPEILIKESTLEVDAAGVIHYDCGCTRQVWMLPEYPGEPFGSWTKAQVCKDCIEKCNDCGRKVCIAGAADGFSAISDGKTIWLCTECYAEWKKVVWREGFWRGFKRMMFGGNDG